jgi:hypothetical protein
MDARDSAPVADGATGYVINAGSNKVTGGPAWGHRSTGVRDPAWQQSRSEPDEALAGQA